jgi:hypothetical protein
MSEKIRLGDLLNVFEDAFYAGWEAHAEGKEAVREEAFNHWVQQTLKEL